MDLYTEVLTPHGTTWRIYYLTLAVLALSTTVVDQMKALLFSWNYSPLIVSVFLVVIALSTAYQLWSTTGSSSEDCFRSK